MLQREISREELVAAVEKVMRFSRNGDVPDGLELATGLRSELSLSEEALSARYEELQSAVEDFKPRLRVERFRVKVNGDVLCDAAGFQTAVREFLEGRGEDAAGGESLLAELEVHLGLAAGALRGDRGVAAEIVAAQMREVGERKWRTWLFADGVEGSTCVACV